MKIRSESIAIRNVSKTFHSTTAVDDVSFDVSPGEVFGLLGPNGAGKTTLIRLIMDIIRPDSGTVQILGHQFRDEDRNRIGYLPEERGIYTRLKVLPTLMYFAMLKGVPTKKANENARNWLARFEMSGLENRRIQELSKGNQQKIQIIASLVADPDILILDEPFSGLDPLNARLLRDIIRDLASQGKTVLLSTHQMTLVETFCQRLLMVDGGRVMLYGTLDEIKRPYSNNAVLVKSDADYGQCDLIDHYVPDAKATKVYLREGIAGNDFLTWLLGRAIHIELFERAEMSLEDIFIKSLGAICE